MKDNIENVFEFFEVRKAIETWNAYFVAQRATHEDIRLLDENTESMKATIEEGNVAPDREDEDFHFSIAGAIHNKIQSHVMFTIWDIVIEFLGKYHRSLRDGHEVFNQHVKILEAIRERNPNLARERILEHLDLVELRFRESIGSETNPE